MSTWIVGDIHGCSAELETLLGRLQLGPGDTFLCVGDLFHRGPDPIGVLDLIEGAGGRFILGNHELRVLDRFGLAPRRTDSSDRPAFREEFGEIEGEELDGDGGRPCAVVPERRGDVLRFLQKHEGFYLENGGLEKAGATLDGRGWCAVHAGLLPGRHPGSVGIEDLVSVRRLGSRGRPYWYEVYNGPVLVIFGHTHSKIPRARRSGGKLVALGIDTGCVYGGKLSAYCPELDELVQVDAERAYARS